MQRRILSSGILLSILIAALHFGTSQPEARANEIAPAPGIPGQAAGGELELFLSPGQNRAYEIAPESAGALVEMAFIYQGYLKKNDAPYHGSCDFAWAIFDVLSGGTALFTNYDSNVKISNGFFQATVELINSIINGNARWLEVQARCPVGSGSYTILTPRQPLLAVPYALGLRLPLTHIVSDENTLFWLTNPSTSTTSPTIYAASAGSTGVWGYSYGGPDAENGIFGETNSNLWSNAGVKGTSTSNATGGHFVSNSGSGIYGSTDSTSGNLASVKGESIDAANGGYFSSSQGDGMTASSTNSSKFGGYFNNSSSITSGGALFAWGDVKQNLEGDGFVKAGAHIMCSNTGSMLGTYFNNVNTSGIGVLDGTNPGECIVDFKFDVTNRFILSRAVDTYAVVTHSYNTVNSTRFILHGPNGLGVNAWITILVY